MSLRIIKNGLSDTFQDRGRYGFQHLGINPGGAMDLLAMQKANVLVGNKPDQAVLEMHFPAAEIGFEVHTLIAIAGGNFDASINEVGVPLLHPLIIAKGAVLKFRKQIKGARVYVAVAGGYLLDNWLDSDSTHIQVKAGGYKGRALQKNDQVLMHAMPQTNALQIKNAFEVLPWFAGNASKEQDASIPFLTGAEYHYLDAISKQKMEKGAFAILPNSNRMGYRLKGDQLQMKPIHEMISSGVTKGTIQLLPDGQLIILMADHQTTGGYPRLGQVTTAGIAKLAQMSAGQKVFFQKTTLEKAEADLILQERNLQQLQNACNLRLESFFK